MTEATRASPAARIAGLLTSKQRGDVLSFEPGEGFMPPHDRTRIQRMWWGIKLAGFSDPIFLLRKAHGEGQYALTDLGLEVHAILAREGQ